jgi:FlgD Ig-like domain/NHL repeat
MRWKPICIALLLAALPSVPARPATFTDAPILEDRGIRDFDRTVTRAELGRDLFGEPYATVVVGNVDVYDRFPYLEARWFQVVTDPAWNRVLAGEIDGRLFAVDGTATPFGALRSPHGLATDEYDRVWVADTGNDRVLVFAARTEYDRIDLEPLFAIDGLSAPYDVAFSDGGTPFVPADDRVYVSDTGRNRVVAFDVRASEATEAFAIGDLGRGPGHFAGPLAIAVGRTGGAATSTVYVADAHNGRIVALRDRGDRFDWAGETAAAGTITSLDTDHWGAVYAASPAGGTITKYTADLAALATLDDGHRPRAFHIPFVNRTDHRAGTVRRVGQGSGVIVDSWTDTSGIRLVRLGVEVKDLHVQAASDVAADFVTTDRAAVRADFLDADGHTVRSVDLGTRDAGAQHVSFVPANLEGIPGGEPVLRITAASPYGEDGAAQAQASFPWNGAGPVPDQVRLIGNEPNPFRSGTAIRFSVPAGATSFDLRVFDIAGRLVRQLDGGAIAPGVHVRNWDGTDQAGRAVRAGIYFVQLGVGDRVATKKVVLLR